MKQQRFRLSAKQTRKSVFRLESSRSSAEYYFKKHDREEREGNNFRTSCESRNVAATDPTRATAEFIPSLNYSSRMAWFPTCWYISASGLIKSRNWKPRWIPHSDKTCNCVHQHVSFSPPNPINSFISIQVCKWSFSTRRKVRVPFCFLSLSFRYFFNFSFSSLRAGGRRLISFEGTNLFAKF